MLQSTLFRRALRPIFMGALVLVFAGWGAAQGLRFPFLNPDLPLESRLDDLIARLTLTEKAALMTMDSPAVPRLGIPAYHWWNESLHGVARHWTATVFPQSIGLAATFDEDLVRRVAGAIGDEARAQYHESVRRGESGTFGLTCWAPNVNIFRDPRWGRGQETYGEDPCLAARMGVAYVRGMQGDDPVYLKTAATPKHFAVHSGPEPLRPGFDARVSAHDLFETYLPAFEACVREGRAASVMAAYSAINGVPCSANRWLLTDLLRGAWGFRGCVVSDVDSVALLADGGHHVASSLPAAAALALKSGLDLNAGDVYTRLPEALRQGLANEAEINRGLREVLRVRFRLGLFDPDARVPYARIPFSENESRKHDSLALEAARKSIVLLKNDPRPTWFMGRLFGMGKKTLPLSRKLRTVAVIGPNANSAEALWGNYNGTPSRQMTILEAIRKKLGADAEVLYAEGCGIVETSPCQPVEVPASALRTKYLRGLRGVYYSSRNLSGTPVFTRIDSHIPQHWPVAEPGAGHDHKAYSASWTGMLDAPADGRYRLSVAGSGNFRLYLDDRLALDSAPALPDNTVEADWDLEPGRTCKIRLEYSCGAGEENLRLLWRRFPSTEPAEAAAAALARRADAVVLVMGLSAKFENEQTQKFRIQGFLDGDRTRLDLPSAQQRLIRAVEEAGRPTVVVLVGGSPISVEGLRDGTALVEAWYPGQRPDAVADVLFGNANPAGRMPVTVYRSAADLPPFTDYGMAGRTYRYFKGKPLYAFGDGLSYTKFEYADLKLDKETIRAGEGSRVSVKIKNTGGREGDEVVQVYLSRENPAQPAPIRALAGFKRIHLFPREERRVEFTLSPDQLAQVDRNGRRQVIPGVVKIGVGGSQRAARSAMLKIAGPGIKL